MPSFFSEKFRLFKDQRKNQTFLVILILLMSFIGVVIYNNPHLIAVETLTNPQMFFQQVDLRAKSYVDIEMVSDSQTINPFAKPNFVRLTFSFNDQDQPKVDALSNQWGIGREWQKGISIGLDPNSAASLMQLLPVRVNVDIEDNQILFTSKGFLTLDSSIPGESYQMSTESASIALTSSDQGFSLKVMEPDILVREATKSGQMNISDNLSPLLPLLEKIKEVEATGKAKALKGKIILH